MNPSQIHHLVGLLIILGSVGGCGSTSHSAGKLDERDVSEVAVSTRPVSTGAASTNGARETQDRQPEAAACGERGFCEVGTTCETEERRCACVTIRECSGVDRGHLHQAPSHAAWSCQDIRCPDPLPIPTSRSRTICTNSTEDRIPGYREPCRLALPCEHEGLHCGTSSGSGCGGSSLSCVEGYWEHRTRPPAP